ncbi:hypothetical protein OAH36_02485 [Verrucomicrobia bacterium]|nr:hypothetical protein [Verrucomicrobiota bacterium]
MGPQATIIAALIAFQPNGKTASMEAEGSPSSFRILDIASEWISSSDLALSSSTLSYRNEVQESKWQLNLNHGSIDMDFRSLDIFTHPAKIREERIGIQGRLERRINQHIRGQAGLQAYDGFATYQGAWLHEYYQQRYGLFGYDQVDPYGLLGNVGSRWEYTPGSGYLQASVSRLHQRIAPGAEFEGHLTLGNTRLNTTLVNLSSENILSQRVKTRVDLGITDTTGRKLRYTLAGFVNHAVSENWVIRSTLSWTGESPGFNAYIGGLTAEYPITDAFLISLSGRYYQDSGEIEDSLLFSAAAPGIETIQFGIGFRYQREHASAKLFIAPYTSRYEPIGRGTEFFGQLYQDRNWILLQLAYSWEF